MKNITVMQKMQIGIPTKKSQEALMDIPKTEYKKCFEDWIKRWHKCVAVDGDYFEGDNIDLDV